VTVAENGKTAVRLAGEEDFDLILMDVRMADMDGLEATRQIRALPGVRAMVPILALTAYTSPDQVAQCLDAGMDGHVPKPVDYQTLIRMIDHVTTRPLDRSALVAGGVVDPASGGLAEFTVI